MNGTKQLNHEYLTICGHQELSEHQSGGGCIRIPRNAFLAWVEQRTTIPKDLRLQMQTA